VADLETGTLLGRIPFARVGAQPHPIVVVAGGQAFVQRPTPERVARDARRIARILPPGRSFLLVSYDPAPPPEYTLGTIGRDLGAILDELGGNASIMGISYGGLAALRAAADHPALVAKLVLLVSAHDFSAEGKRRVQRQIDFAARGDLVGLTEDFAAICRRPWLNWLIRRRLRASRARLPQLLNEPALIIRGLRAVLDDPLEPAQLARITAPCLIVGGTQDQFFGDGMQQETAALLPRASLELVPGETHMLPVERPRHLARVLRGFLG
jgi:pimeloyl-ACP methyl ester carboxylesterase